MINLIKITDIENNTYVINENKILTLKERDFMDEKICYIVIENYKHSIEIDKETYDRIISEVSMGKL